jgi:hypothetical protein
VVLQQPLNLQDHLSSGNNNVQCNEQQWQQQPVSQLPQPSIAPLLQVTLQTPQPNGIRGAWYHSAND